MITISYDYIIFIISLITIWGYLIFLYLCFCYSSHSTFPPLQLKGKILESRILSVLFIAVFLAPKMMNGVEKMLKETVIELINEDFHITQTTSIMV